MRKNTIVALILWSFVVMATASYWYDDVFGPGGWTGLAPEYAEPVTRPQGRHRPRVEGLVASFTATAVSGKLAANQTDFIWYFDLSNAPGAFWSAVDDAGATIRVFDSGATRLPVHVVSIDTSTETGWLAWKADGLAASDNVFTIDTDGSAFSPGSDVALTITNPGAESGTTGWTNDTGTLVSTNAYAHSGTQSFKGGDNDAATVAHQDISVPGGQQSRVDADGYDVELSWWQQSAAGQNDRARMGLEFLDGGAATIRAIAYSEYEAPQTEVQKYLRLHVPAGTRSIRISYSGLRAAGNSLDAYVDDLTLTLKETDENGPAAVWSEFLRAQTFGETWDDATGARNVVGPAEPGLWSASDQAVSASATQGVTWDGTFYYLSGNNFLIKYNSSWVSQATNNDPAGDLGIAGLDHLGDISVNDGVIYAIVADDAGGYTEAHVATYSATDLSFIDSFEITSLTDPQNAGLWYNPADDLIYMVNFNNGANDEISVIDPVSETLDSTIALSRSLAGWLIQGITNLNGRFYVSAGEPYGSDPGGIVVIDTDGTVHTAPVYSSAASNQQGIGTKEGGLLLLLGNASSVRALSRQPALDMGLGRAVELDGANTVFPTIRGLPAIDEFTIGLTALSDGNGSGSPTALSYINEDAAEANNDHIKFAEHASNNEWGTEAPQGGNGWADSGVAVSTVNAQRVHWVYNGTTHRKVYVDGTLGVTDSTLSDPGYSDFFALMIGREDAGEFNLFSGRLGFLYFYPGELDADWIADEHEQLSDNANFWGVEAGPTVFIDAVHDDSVDASTSAYTGPGTHTDTQWQIALASDPTFTSPVYDSGDDETNLVSIDNAGSGVPLAADTPHLIRARHKTDDTSYSAWSDAVPFTTSGGVVGVPVPKDFRVIVYEKGEDVGGAIDFALQDPHLVTPLEIGGQAARVLDGVSESVPYTVRFHDPDDEFSALLFDANGRPAVLGRVVEVRLIEQGTSLTIDVRRLGALRLLEPPAVEMELIDERQFDRVVLFAHNPTIKAINPGPAGFGSAWATIPDPGGTGGEVVGSSGDFRQIDEDASSIFLTHGPQKAAIERDVIDSPSGSNTTGNFKTLIARIGGITRPITSFGALSAATADDVLDLDNWGVADLTPPPFWVYWPGGPASGSAGEVEIEFTQSGELGHLPGVPTTAEMPFLVEEDDIRDLLTNIATPGGLYAPSGTTPLRFLLPSTAELPADRLPTPISIAVPAPIRRADMLIQVARIAGLVLWTDSQGRIVPRPWAVPPIADFTQMDLDALFLFDASSATTVPTYEAQVSRAFNVWKAQGTGIFPRSVSLADTPFIGAQLEDDEVEFEDTASSPIGPNRVAFTASFPGYIVSDALVSNSPLSVGETFVGQTLGGQAEGRIQGHAVANAPLPGDLVLLDHDSLKGLNPGTGDRTGQQLARVVDRRRTYTEAEVYFDYRLIYGGEA